MAKKSTGKGSRTRKKTKAAAKKKKTVRKKKVATKAKRATRKTTAKSVVRKKTAKQPTTPEVESGLRPSHEVYIDKGAPLPAGFGEDRIVALVRDPEWIFLYWELQGEKSNSLVKKHGGGKEFRDCPWALRVSFPDRGETREIPIDVTAGNYYLEVGRDQRVPAAIGFYDPDGNFISVASTPEVSTVTQAGAPDYQEQWMRRPFRTRGERSYTGKITAAPPELSRAPVGGVSSRFTSSTLKRK